MSTEMDLFFGLAGLGTGLYCLYAAIMMRRTGIVNQTILLDQETKQKKCKDIGEYLSVVIPPTTILGIITTIYGIVSLLNLYVVECDMALYIVMALTMAALIWFAIVTGKAKKEYY